MSVAIPVPTVLERDTGWYQTQPDGVEERVIEAAITIGYFAGNNNVTNPAGVLSPNYTQSNIVFAADTAFTADALSRSVKSITSVMTTPSNGNVTSADGGNQQSALAPSAGGHGAQLVLFGLNAIGPYSTSSNVSVQSAGSNGFVINVFAPDVVTSALNGNLYYFVVVTLRRPAYT